MQTSTPLPSSLHADQALAAARILLARRHSGEQGDALPTAIRPATWEAAFAIQCAVSGLNASPVAAWKCALPASGQSEFAPVLAPVYADCLHRPSHEACPVWARHGQVKIEPELAFILGQDLPARSTPYSAAEVDAAIAETRLALELIDTRYIHAEQLGFNDHLADGLYNQGLLLGPVIDSQLGQSATDVNICLNIAHQAPLHLAGRHPAGKPRLPLYWLAEFLRQQGMGLLTGQAVITGSYAGSPQVPAGVEVRLEFSGLGTIQTRFQEKPAM